MDAERWSRDDLLGRDAAALVDDLDDVSILVLDGVFAHDDHRLHWCRRAPCPVVAVVTPGDDAPSSVDLVVGDGGALERLVDAAAAAPTAARTLAEVLRTVPHLDVARGLLVESFAYSTLLASGEFRAWLAEHRRPPRPPLPGPALRVERVGRELRITLRRPENRNAFGAALRDALHAALLPAELDPSITEVYIDAEGPVFSSGGDLDEFGTASDVARAHEIRTLRSVGAAIDRMRDRVTVRVHGTCVGAGVELPAFAGRVVAAAGTTFRLPEVAMGLIPGAGGTVSLSARIGAPATAELALSGRTMELDEAVALGLVDAVDD